MMNPDEKLVFQILDKRFSDYFNAPQNTQILFSGPFGSGKTTFLKTFFENREDVNTFRIFPVNYALHANSDIYEILKYDVILELIHKDAFEKIDISNLTKYLFTTMQGMDKAIGKMLSVFSSTGRSLSEAVDILEEVIVDQKSASDQLDDPLLAIKDFKKTIDKVKKYSHEDYITGVIKQKLEHLKTKSKKQNVLIVDDMDRIDPEHLFRIISIFSSHIDNDEANNKFGFDKIIFVGDNENFRSIFCHKYGMMNNYDAYISKLSSKSPFHYDPEGELYEKIKHLVKEITFSSEEAPQPKSIYNSNIPHRERYYNYILCSLIKAGAISLRELVKFKGNTIQKAPDDRYVDDLQAFPQELGAYNLYLILHLFAPNYAAMKAMFEKALMDPLPADRVLKGSNYDRNAIICDLSIVPLETIFATESKKLENADKTFERQLDTRMIEVYHVKKSMSRDLSFQLTPRHASEKLLLELTLESLRITNKYFPL